MITRRLTFRAKLIGITALPLAVIGYLAFQDVREALDTRQAAADQAVELDRQQAVADLADALSGERAVLFDPTAADGDLSAARAGVDEAMDRVRTDELGVDPAAVAAAEEIYGQVTGARAEIGSAMEPIQLTIAERQEGPLLDAVEGFTLLPQQVPGIADFEVVDRETLANLTTTVLLQRARESLALEGVALQQALAEGAPSQDTLERVEQLIGSSDEAVDVVLDLGEPATGEQVAAFLDGPVWGEYQAIRDRFTRLLIGQRIRLEPEFVLEERAAVATEFERLEAELEATMDADTAALDEQASSDLTLAIALAAGVLALLTLFLLLLARSIRRSLGRVESRATEIANTELPAIVHMMRTEGDQAEIPRIEEIPVETQDEIGRLSAAFNELHRTAIRLAGEQAASRAVVAHMFVNLGRRNQKLLMRILKSLDDLERNESDPDRLARIYEVDHLATRMRRNAESLLILADADVARRFEGPVRVSELLRSTMAEVEEYQRIKLNILDDVEIVGDAAADLAHLVSELTENAARFSPPTEPIEIVARYTRVGYILAVIDNGMGLAENEIMEANARIASAATSAETPSRNLGHFVVGKLAGKYGMEVEVFDRVPAGLTVRIRIPWSMIVSQPPVGVIDPAVNAAPNPTQETPTVAVASPAAPAAAAPAADTPPSARPTDHVRSPSPAPGRTPAPAPVDAVTTGSIPAAAQAHIDAVTTGSIPAPAPQGAAVDLPAPRTDPLATGPINMAEYRPAGGNSTSLPPPPAAVDPSGAPTGPPTAEVDPVFGTTRRVAGANLPDRVGQRPRPEPDATALKRSAEAVGSNLGALQRGLQGIGRDDTVKGDR